MYTSGYVCVQVQVFNAKYLYEWRKLYELFSFVRFIVATGARMCVCSWVYIHFNIHTYVFVCGWVQLQNNVRMHWRPLKRNFCNIEVHIYFSMQPPCATCCWVCKCLRWALAEIATYISRSIAAVTKRYKVVHTYVHICKRIYRSIWLNTSSVLLKTYIYTSAYYKYSYISTCFSISTNTGIYICTQVYMYLSSFTCMNAYMNRAFGISAYILMYPWKTFLYHQYKQNSVLRYCCLWAEELLGVCSYIAIVVASVILAGVKTFTILIAFWLPFAHCKSLPSEIHTYILSHTYVLNNTLKSKRNIFNKKKNFLFLARMRFWSDWSSHLYSRLFSITKFGWLF